MESFKGRGDGMNIPNDKHLKESLPEEDHKTWKKVDIIPRRFDELPPESDWIPIADVIRTQREETAKAEAKQIKIMPPLDSDSESLDQDDIQPHGLLEKEVTQKKMEKKSKAKDKNYNSKLKKLDGVLDKEAMLEEREKNLQANENNGKMKLKTLDEDSIETDYGVDAVTRSMMNWVLKPDHFTKKKGTDLDRRKSAPVISLSEYSKKVLPSKPQSRDHHYDKNKIPPEHRELKRGSVQLPPKDDPPFQLNPRYREPSPDYELDEQESLGGPGMDVKYLMHHPEYDDYYHDADQGYTYDHDSRPYYDFEPPLLDLDYGGRYHDPRPHDGDPYLYPEYNHAQDLYYDVSPAYEEDHYPGLYQHLDNGYDARLNSSHDYYRHDQCHVQDFQQSMGMHHKLKYKHQPRSSGKPRKLNNPH